MLALAGPYSIHLLNADDAPRQQAWSKPERRLTWYLLVLCRAGRERIVVDGETYDIRDGDSYLIAPGCRSSLGSRDGNRPYWIHFEVRWDAHRGRHPDAVPFTDDWEQRRAYAQPSPRETWGVDLPVVVPAPLRGLLAEGLPRVIRAWKKGGAVDVMRAAHELGGLLLAMVSHARAQQTGGPRATDLAGRLLSAERLAREKLAEPFGVSEFAAAAGLSRSRFSVLYRQHHGISPGLFLRRLRLARAETLLRHTDLPVVEIAALAGYPDASAFGRVFRAAYHQTPAAFRTQEAR